MMHNRVVITGLGVLAANGIGVESFSSALFSGVSGIKPITAFDASNFKTKVAGEIYGFDPEDFMEIATVRKTDRFAQLGIAAAKMAIEDTGVLTQEGGVLEKAGVFIGSGLGGLMFHEEMIHAFIEGKKIAASAVPRITPNAVSAYIALTFKIKGPNLIISTACSSSAQAIGEAFHKVRSGMLDMAIAGGVEATLTPVNVSLYEAMMVLGSSISDKPSEASRPFDSTRNGFIMGEGGACLILENYEKAKKRGARIYAEIAGFGSNCGAYHMVAPDPSGEDAKEVMQKAILDADLSLSDVNYINAHGTATKYNDLAETKAIKSLFGKRAYDIPISGIKSTIGHTIGASGAIQAVATCLSINNDIAAPTMNLKHPDPECDLDYVPNQSRKFKVNVVLSNSFGFGSNNASLLFKKENV